jgi:hypothetical protein
MMNIEAKSVSMMNIEAKLNPIFFQRIATKNFESSNNNNLRFCNKEERTLNPVTTNKEH